MIIMIWKVKSLSRGLKLEDSGKKFVVGATSLIIVIIVNFGTCLAGLRSYTGPGARRNSQLPPWSSPPVTRRLQNAPLFMTGCSGRFEKGCNDRADSPNADAPQRLLRTLIKHALLRWRVNREDSSPSSLPFAFPVVLHLSPTCFILRIYPRLRIPSAFFPLVDELESCVPDFVESTNVSVQPVV